VSDVSATFGVVLLGLAVVTVLAVWVLGLVDVARRRDLRRRAKLGWAVAFVLFPSASALAYLLLRPVEVDRTIVGAPASTPTASRRGAGRRSARAVQQVARMAARGLFRSVEVARPASVATSGPQLWCASHFGAFSDPIVLLHGLERQPRFLAADALFRVPLLRSVLRLVAAIPVRRSQDGGGAANAAMFAACHEALAAGDALAIFPEGVATEGAAVAPLRTGAARIALGARAVGAAGQQLVPVGIHYQDRAALRRRVYVDVGEPLDLDAWLWTAGRDPATATDADHVVVRDLTTELDRRLRTVAPQFEDLEEAVALHGAAVIALDRDGRRATWGERAELAADLGRRPNGDRAALVAAVQAYRAGLDAAGLSDAEVREPAQRSRRRLLLTGLAGLALLPFAVAGAIIHAPLVLLVRAASRLRVAAPTLATILPAVALLGALLTWGIAAWLLADPAFGAPVIGPRDGRAGGVVLWLLALPLWGWAALVVGERVALAWTGLRHRRRAGHRLSTDIAGMLRADRERVVALVTAGPPATREAEPQG
jgi:glycerol-3-phosphate O-acyltransferase / dihydroxyacetone phosphate acyltransferase